METTHSHDEAAGPSAIAEKLMSLVLEPAELWTLRHGSHAVRCLATPHPLGVEVRYLINENPLMARVLPTWSDVAGVSDSWRRRLEAQGWVVPHARPSDVRH
jgi:hypothetical protein